MRKPYMGKILMVDLSDQTMIPESIPDRVYEDYLSGMGLGAYILYNRMPAGADPLLSLIHISEPTRLLSNSYAVFCLKKKKTNKQTNE